MPLKGDPVDEKNTNTEAYTFASEEQKQLIEVHLCKQLLKAPIPALVENEHIKIKCKQRINKT